MPVQVWGTFSVADHLRKRPFVADVLLYDKLLIPVVPENDQKVRSRWRKRGWCPEDQEKYIEVLTNTNTNLVWAVPWDLQKNENFKSRFEAARGIAFDTHNLSTHREVNPNLPAYHVTRLILEDYARDSKNWCELSTDVWVESMAAYPSYEAFAEDVSVRMGGKSAAKKESHLAGVFGWEFLVPEEPKMSDLDLLRVTAELASDPSFKEKRQAFHDWRRKVANQGITDRAALEEMTRLIHEYNDLVRNSQIRTKTLNGFTVAGIAASLAASFAIPTAGLAGAFFGIGRFAAEKWMPGCEPSPDQRAAAMFHDARKRLGWRRPSIPPSR